MRRRQAPLDVQTRRPGQVVSRGDDTGWQTCPPYPFIGGLDTSRMPLCPRRNNDLRPTAAEVTPEAGPASGCRCLTTTSGWGAKAATCKGGVRVVAPVRWREVLPGGGRPERHPGASGTGLATAAGSAEANARGMGQKTR